MCGIAAIVHPDPEKRRLVRNMITDLRQRGPDHNGVWGDEACTLGHTRLALLDLSPAGDQPMGTASWMLSYNGEIYNHQHLRGRWAGFKGNSDTETLLHLIGQHGVRGTLPKLRGMWAFAAWDRVERKLYVATDPFGIKPLYVHHDPERRLFACASSSAALLRLKPKWKVNTAGLAQFFHLGGSLGVWQGIQRLTGGTLGIYDATAGTWTTERWYVPRFRPYAAEEIERALEQAIRGAGTADVPVGIFFSGGIDSTVVAEVLGPGRTAFHLQSPELAYASQAASLLGLSLHVVADNSARVTTALADIAARTGEPTMAGFIPWLVSEYAAQHVKACISANGADELFFGYDRIGQEQPAQDAHLLRDPANWLPKKWPAPQWHVPELPAGKWPACAASRWRELMLYVQHDLNPTLDAASMCHSLELRVPYLDVELVECALSLPAKWHGRKHMLKQRLLRAGFNHDFAERPKLGFSMKAEDPNLAAYRRAALKQAHISLGLQVGPRASGRDARYIEACAAGWLAWHEQWKSRTA